MIRFDKVNFEYQSDSPFASQALFDIGLEIADGSFTALIGHTGSGKSTLIQHLNGLLRPTAGTVTVDLASSRHSGSEAADEGNEVSVVQIKSDSKQKEIKPVRKRVGVVFQFPEAQLFDETVLKDVSFGPQNFGIDREKAEDIAREKLQQVGIAEEFLERSPFELSGGQMRRVAIAGILAMEPEVLVLDEPTAGLDPKARIEMMTLFSNLHKNQGLTVVLVTHNMDDVADYANFVYLLEKGRIVKSGLPSDVFQSPEFMMTHQLGLPKAAEFALKLQRRGTVKFDRLPITRTELVEALKQAKNLQKRDSTARRLCESQSESSDSHGQGSQEAQHG